MAVYTRPGVYVQETLNPVAPILGANSTAIAAFVGTSDRGPTTPTLISSWSQYVTYFGGWNGTYSTTPSNNNLAIAVYLFFANGGAQAYVSRVTGTVSYATVTGASASAGVVTYIASNTFAIGQLVTITGLSTTAFNLSAVTIATATSTQFTVSNAATGTTVTGASASAVATTGSPVSASRTFTDRAGTALNTVKLSAKNPGQWGNQLNISIDNSLITNYVTVTVFLGGSNAGNVVEQWTDVTMVPTDSRYLVTVINQNSNYITAADSNSSSAAPLNNPLAIANAAFTGGTDNNNLTSTAINSNLSGFDTVLNSLILNIPGYTDVATINTAAIAYATGTTRNNDVFVVIDGINDTVDNQLALAVQYTTTAFAAVYYPQITISDPTASVGSPSGATKTVGAGGAVVGLYAKTDASRGVFKAPAGLQARLAGAVSVASISPTDLGRLNSSAYPVNAIRYIPGSGIVVMGARTLNTSYLTKYVPVRRSLTYLEKSLSDLTQFAVFEPNDYRLWSRVTSVCTNFLNAFWQQGGLFGSNPQAAFFVKCDADTNPQSAIDNGYLNIQVGVSLQRPAEFVIINIGQFNGGTTVTTA
jgi:uncharacterized protein